MGGKKRKRNDENQFSPTFTKRDGWRYITPYIFNFETFVKGRWIGKTIFDIFSTEFGAHKVGYYRQAIKSGRITVNGEHVSIDYVLRNGDMVAHKTHRHEPPVIDTEIEVIKNNHEVLVVNKPATMPMHPCGSYRFNTLFYILTSEVCPPPTSLHIVHRLDRLTSGVTIFAKSSEYARKFQKEIEHGTAKKTYLARVIGNFPENATTETKCSENEEKKSNFGWKQNESDEIIVRYPIGCVSFKNGVFGCDPKGKFSETKFRKLSYNGQTSLVECRPITGRTHQIRLHLQFLNHPIANDPNYGGELFYGDEEKKARFAQAKQFFTSQMDEFKEEIEDGEEEKGAQRELLAINNLLESKEEEAKREEKDEEIKEEEKLETKDEIKQEDDDPVWEQLPDETEETFLIRTCEFCKKGDEEAFNQNQLHSTGIWLHALRYEGSNWSFESSFPDWAQGDFAHK